MSQSVLLPWLLEVLASELMHVHKYCITIPSLGRMCMSVCFILIQQNASYYVHILLSGNIQIVRICIESLGLKTASKVLQMQL